MKQIEFRRSVLDALPLPPSGTRAEYQDKAAPELTLRMTPTGHKTFCLRRKINGKATRVTLGTYMGPTDTRPVMTVEQARRAATKAKAAAVEGINPNEVKRARRMEGMTLRQMLDAYVAVNAKLKGGTGGGYLAALQATVKDWLDKPLRDITSEKVLAAHKKHGARSHAGANLGMRVVRLVWNFAKTHNTASATIYGPNPVDVLSERKAWFHVPRRKTVIKRHNLPAWWAGLNRLREADMPAAAEAADVMEVLLYTGLRSGEVREMAWEQVDLRGRTVFLPDPKNRNPVELPLPSQLMTLIERRKANATPNARYVFPATDPRQPFNKSTLRKYAVLLRDETGVPFVPHDLRRGFTSTAEKLTSFLTAKRLANHKAIEADVTAGYVVEDEDDFRQASQRVADRIEEALTAKSEVTSE
jgi:integrase